MKPSSPGTTFKQPSGLCTRDHIHLVGYYLLFGSIHELSHVVTAWSVLGYDAFLSSMTFKWWVSVLFLRRTPAVAGLDRDDDSAPSIIRHAGWIASLLIACVIVIAQRYRSEKPMSSSARLNLACCAAFLASLEAVCTDLLRIPVIPLFPSDTRIAYYCGNFGILLLHQAWWNNRKGWDPSLSVLEKMIQITMMRGAQSGGVVSYLNDKYHRVRIVNYKRTSLAQLLRQALQRKLPSPSSRSNSIFLAGHTRFATSSKATLEGTHPQQWTPTTSYTVWCPHKASFVATKVENYITHNGDFEFYTMRNNTVELHAIQQFLSVVTGIPTPASVDSCAIAGMVDVLRTQGCFTLSIRYALCFGLSTSTMDVEQGKFPVKNQLDAIASIFEEAFQALRKELGDGCSNGSNTIENRENRIKLAKTVAQRLYQRKELLSKPAKILGEYITKASMIEDLEEPEEVAGGGSSLFSFCLATVDAFYDNDLFQTMRIFLARAKGSFGLCFTSSLDAHRQIVLAARGQTMSVAFYPSKGLVCYGSEQAAVKAGIQSEFPGKDADALGRSRGEIDNDALRLDLDDLGGEILLLDWGKITKRNESQMPIVSHPNQDLAIYELMNGSLNVVIFRADDDYDTEIYHRMTRLTRNRNIKPLKEETDDLILSDIQDIPSVCQAIQDEWHTDKKCKSMNRLTAFHLSRCLRRRLEDHLQGKIPNNAIDILLTGCEVSLWVAEQFASDLQKALPRLRVKALSSNKLLGMYGQEIAIPGVGFPDAPKTYSLVDTIIIIVSHSGGTFAPLACSNLLQSTTRNLFAVTSEWDTQIGKQLRAMDALDDDNECAMTSRIFSTEVGMRTAEPCSISVAATHQLMTNLLLYISAVILSENRFRGLTGALVTEQDLQIIETCNQNNVGALEDITGAGRAGDRLNEKDLTEAKLRSTGDLWAEHILENARAYAMSFLYIFATVVSGYPLFFGIATLCGLTKSSSFMYLIRVLDAAVYFWMPQINITIVRIFQGRNLRHRMVGRTVVIGDIPWVAQAAEAFLSKIFAVSYSIAGLNVLSGNPADHLVHRHTHRVVRGTLVVCGRPDGRLSALSTAESAVCLAVNQASSIQSFGGTCESITVGHNPFKLPLTSNAIFLKRKRPQFLCERILTEADFKEEQRKDTALTDSQHSGDAAKADDLSSPRCSNVQLLKATSNRIFGYFKTFTLHLDESLSPSFHDPSIRPRNVKNRSAAAYLGAYTSDITEPTIPDVHCSDSSTCSAHSIENIIEQAIHERKFSDRARNLFSRFDNDGDGFLSEQEFIQGAKNIGSDASLEELQNLFKMYNQTIANDLLDYNEFVALMKDHPGLTDGLKIPTSHRDDRGMIRIEPTTEKYFGEKIRKLNAGKSKNDIDYKTARSQNFAQELYESRIASLQRFVAMTVMFHQMGMRVERFFRIISFGLLGYRMDRTHSIMRIATTASPVSGADVKEQMRNLHLMKRVQHSVDIISHAYKSYILRKQAQDDDKLKAR